MKGLGLGSHSGVTPLFSISTVFVTLTLGINRPLGVTPGMPSPYAQDFSQFHAFLGEFFAKLYYHIPCRLDTPSTQNPDATPLGYTHV